MKTIALKSGKNGKIVLKKYRLTRILESWIEIHTSVEKAWNTLVDFESWSQWNSFIPMAKGNLKVGNKISIKVTAPGLKAMHFKPTVFEVEECKKIVWGGGFLPLGYKGVHEFRIEYAADNVIRFKQIEKFQGPVVLCMHTMIRKTALGYATMNEEFKKLLEND